MADDDLDAERFVRQLLLPEIGEAGQARLSACRAALGGPGAANEIATRYAHAAGVSVIEPGPVDVTALAPAEVVAHSGPRAVLAGARAALAAIREGVGLPRRSPRTEVALGLPAAGPLVGGLPDPGRVA